MPIGVDRHAALGDLYGPEVVDELAHLGDHVDRWALPEGQRAILGSFTAQLPLSRAISEMASGSQTPDEAAASVATSTEDMVTR